MLMVTENAVFSSSTESLKSNNYLTSYLRTEPQIPVGKVIESKIMVKPRGELRSQVLSGTTHASTKLLLLGWSFAGPEVQTCTIDTLQRFVI